MYFVAGDSSKGAVPLKIKKTVCERFCIKSKKCYTAKNSTNLERYLAQSKSDSPVNAGLYLEIPDAAVDPKRDTPTKILLRVCGGRFQTCLRFLWINKTRYIWNFCYLNRENLSSVVKAVLESEPREPVGPIPFWGTYSHN